MTMNDNITKMVNNQENLENLSDKADKMKTTSNQFKKSATTIKRNMWWKNMKLNLIIAVVVIVILIIIIVPIALKYK